MNRLDKIKQEFLKRFQSKLAEEGVDLSVESAFDILISADPSRNKKNVRWLMESYLNDGFLWEDIQSGHLSKVHDTLNTFIRNKNKLDAVDRSINRYESIADMWKMVKPYADDKTGKEVKREEYDKAMSESEMVIDNDDIRVVVPLTVYASKFHGRGTRWCTAADSNNMFLRYALVSPLFIITLKESGDKLQLWKDYNEIQFMDADDADVTKEYIKENWNVLNPVIRFFESLEYIPEGQITYEICMEACKRDGIELDFVPDMTPDGVPLKTYELCKVACQTEGLALEFVPEEFLTPEICEIACRQEGLALELVPEELRTYELLKIACEQNGMVIQYVIDNEDRTYELCLLACKQNGLMLEYIDPEYITPELCKVACQQNGCALQYVPEYTSDGISLITPELCKIACEQDGSALQYVPDMTSDGVSLKTPELYEIACESNGMALKHVPKEFRTDKMCEIACKQNRLAISIVKDLEDWNDIYDAIHELEPSHTDADEIDIKTHTPIIEKMKERFNQNCFINHGFR